MPPTFLTRYDGDTKPPSAADAARDLAVRALAPMVVWWALVVAGGWMLTDGPLSGLGRSEKQINDDLEAGRTPTMDAITLVFSWMGATASIIGLCLVVVGVIWWRTRRWWFAVVPLIAITLQALVFFFATLVIDRDRPDVHKLDHSPPTSSYPSGHTGAATALYFSLALLALRIRHPVLRALVVGLCVAAPFGVAGARLYRGMHHVSDVSVSIISGTLAVALAWAWVRREAPDPVSDPASATDSDPASDPGVPGSGEAVDAERGQAERDRDRDQDDLTGGKIT